MNNKEGLRFNEGKLRYDLIHPQAEKGLVEVLTSGASKYSERNWELGMKWSKVLASMKRHIAAIERGEDVDSESGLLHADHVQANAHFLSAYYKIAPQFDDRPHSYLNAKKISLDLDDCLAFWTKAWSEKHNIPLPKNWDFSYSTRDKLLSMNEKEIVEFYSTLPTKINPEDIKFNIHCYITARSLDNEINKQWIEANGFPTKPVYNVGFGESKVEVFKKSGADYHIDDSYDNFVEMSKAGICCFLLSTPHNIHFDVGFKRINNFSDFYERFLK